jgi:uncharacterized protein (DUF169 family)
MNSQLVNALKLKMQPVAVILTNDKPADGLHFKEGSMGGCIAAMLVAASKKNRIAFFDRKTFGCPGGGTDHGTGRTRVNRIFYKCGPAISLSGNG